MGYEETKKEVADFLSSLENRTPISTPQPTYKTPHCLEEDRSHPHQFGLVAPSGAPQVRTLTEAQKWIDILWRYAVQDAERMNAISDRIDRIELALQDKAKANRRGIK